MNPAEQREALKNVYSGADWQKKVATMSNAQVVAIYLSLKRQGKL